MAPTESARNHRWALILLFIAPVLFASNMLMAKVTHDFVPPVALAFGRWAVALAILLPFTARSLWTHRQALAREWRDLLILGALGMGVCGAFVYIAADTTSATNIGLIYAASPILIVIIARWVYHEAMSAAQTLGVCLSLIGVLSVICRGDLAVLTGFRFTEGDLWIVAATIGWAVYSVLLNYRKSALPALARFAAITGGGVVVLLPFTLWEAVRGDVITFNALTLGSILFLALVPALSAYLSYGFIQRQLGAGPTGLLMYLIPLYNAVLAHLLLGEALGLYHLVGMGFLLSGIFLATRKPKLPRSAISGELR